MLPLELAFSLATDYPFHHNKNVVRFYIEEILSNVIDDDFLDFMH